MCVTSTEVTIYGNSHGNTKWRFRARALRTSTWQKFLHLAFDQGQGHCSPGISYFGKVSTKRKKQCMHQLIEDKGSSDGGCDRVWLRLQCLAFAARLRRSSALCGCPSCLELDQVENNPRVTLLPLRVTDRDKWEKGDDIPRVQEKVMAKPQKILCFVERQRKKRFLLPKDTRKLVVIDEEEPEAPRLSSCSSVWAICGKLWTSRIFAVQCIQKLFSQTLFDFKKSISGQIELKFSGKTLYAIL